jgi:5-formyltetrahydrofolate cyclo-ligase
VTTSDAMRPSDAKRALRSELIALRARLSLDDRFERSRVVAERLEALPLLTTARTVALYAPLGTEVDALELARRLTQRGARVAFPRVVEGDRRLAFGRCDPCALVRGPLGAREPPPGATVVDGADIDVFVIPGVAFSLDGLRLGRGGGYYDATLRAFPRAARVGACFDLQLVPTLPREPHDAPLDAVVTDARTLQFERDPR